MGKIAKEIAGPGTEGTIEMLKTAYSAELSAFHYFWYISQNIEGLGVLEQDFFEERAKEELGHAKKVAFRLMQLEVTPIVVRSSVKRPGGAIGILAIMPSGIGSTRWVRS